MDNRYTLTQVFKTIAPLFIAFSSILLQQSSLNSSAGQTTFKYEPCVAGVIEGRMLTLGSKNIYLFGMHHKASTLEANKKQLIDLLSALKATEGLRKNPLHILIEKETFNCSHSIYKILEMALQSKTDEQTLPRLHEITIENAEIREISSKVDTRLESPYCSVLLETQGLYENFEEFGGEVPPIAINPTPILRFHQLFKEFEDHLKIIEEFRSEFPTNTPKLCNFDNILEITKDEFEEFKAMLNSLEIDIQDGVASSAHNYIQKHSKEGEEAIAALNCINNRMFSNLFDLWLFKKIYEHEGANLAVFAGAKHTEVLRAMLYLSDETSGGPYINNNPASFNHSDPRNYELVKLLSKNNFETILKGRTLEFYFETLCTLINTSKYLLCLIAAAGLLVQKKGVWGSAKKPSIDRLNQNNLKLIMTEDV